MEKLKIRVTAWEYELLEEWAKCWKTTPEQVAEEAVRNFCSEMKDMPLPEDA